ncbi:iron-siderophore ABC transporter substrate-binding protein [Lonepinella sp. BR2271]|uniref:iron-siderophore ABC transporter substrate-binding protein n=1 Tax=Lonepinella sp. BR2271 TaxID=3434550 RepID=UPI003F6E3891
MLKILLKSLFISLLSLKVFAQIPVATLDWTVAETLIALDNPPVAIGDKPSYQRWVGEPKLPASTLDLGLRMQPNKEMLSQIKVEMFINSNFFANLSESLQPLSPTHLVNFYQDGDIWQNMQYATRQIGALISQSENAEKLIEQTFAYFEQLKTELESYQQRPLAIVQFIDARHLRFYGRRSLFGAVIEKLGFSNAWQQTGGLWGSENLAITELAKLPANTRLIVVKPHPANVEKALQYNSLWQQLSLSKDPLILPATWTFGALPSARIFAERLAQGLKQGGESW